MEGDQDIENVYRRYFPIIREKCRRMLESAEEAQDVAQETFIRFWRSNSQTLEPQQAVAWLYRTSTRLAVDRIRKRRPERAVVEEFLARGEAQAPADELELRRFFSQVAGQVPPKEWEVAVLFRVDALDQREISQVTQQSERTIRRLLSRFDERVRALLSEAA